MGDHEDPLDFDPLGAGGTDEGDGDEFDEYVAWSTATWPVIDPIVEAIVNRVQMAQRRLERSAVKSREAAGLAQGELKILLRLARRPRSQGEVAKALLVSTGTMTNQLDKLEAAGLVVRKPDPNDRRGKQIEITPKGHEVVSDYVNRQAKVENEMFSDLGDEDKQELNRLLRRLLASLSTAGTRSEDGDS